MIIIFYTLKELSKLTGIAEAHLKASVENGGLIPVHFGSNNGVTKVSLVEYNRYALGLQYGDHPRLLETAMRCLELTNPVVENG